MTGQGPIPPEASANPTARRGVILSAGWVVITLGALLVYAFSLPAIFHRRADAASAQFGAALPGLGLSPAFVTLFFTAAESLFLIAALVTGLAALRLQTNTARKTARQQAKWVLFGGGIALGGAVLFALVDAIAGPWQNELHHLVFRLAAGLLLVYLPAIALPVSVGFALARRRLWDIDYLLNRSLVLGALLTGLLALFAASFLFVRTAASMIPGIWHALLALTITTAAAGVLWAPVRRRFTSLVDRELYHIRIAYIGSGTQTTPVFDAPAVGTPAAATPLRLGDFEGMEHVATGGMSQVYRARHPASGEPVAVKILFQHLAQQEPYRRHFQREAEMMASLYHPGIPRIYDHGCSADGQLYTVLEYLEGGCLLDHIRQRGRLLLVDVIPLLHDIAGILDYIHKKGIIHRDIKPSNVLLRPVTDDTGHTFRMRAALMDFGIARIIGDSSPALSTAVVGTFDYMAPEQIRNEPDIDARADIYSMGVMAYEMLTGRLPFATANTAALLIAHLNQPPPDPRSHTPGLPVHVAEAVLSTLEKDPGRRFASAGAFAEALRGG